MKETGQSHLGRWVTMSSAVSGFLPLTLLVFGGCGGGSSDSSVVPPPSPAVVESAPSDTEPPGSLELPEVDIPPPNAGEDQKSTSEGGFEMPEGAKIPADSGASVQPKVQFATWQEIEDFAKSSGRITVVDLWSLSCEPCLKEFPGLVHLHKTLGSTVQCVAVDLDFDGRETRPPQHYQDRVQAFLSSVDAAGFPTYISETPNDEVFATTKLVSIPAVLIYDTKGDIVSVFVDAGETAGFTYEKDVIPLVKKLAG